MFNMPIREVPDQRMARLCLVHTKQVCISADIDMTPMLAMMKAHISYVAIKKTPAMWIRVTRDGSSNSWMRFQNANSYALSSFSPNLENQIDGGIPERKIIKLEERSLSSMNAMH